jgi:hypothetical protein
MALPLQRLPERPFRTLPGGILQKFLPRPHYSRAFLLQSPIRCYDEPSASGLAPQTLTVLHEYASGPHGSARRSPDAAQRFRDEPS